MNGVYQVAVNDGHTYYRWVGENDTVEYADEIVASFEREEDAAKFVEVHYPFFEWENDRNGVEFAPEIEELLERNEFRGRMAQLDALIAVYAGTTGNETPFVELLTTIQDITEKAGYYYSPKQDETYRGLLTELHDLAREAGM